ncbi:sugar-binding domain-containing protein, partial [Dysgonomonas sp. UBA7698]
MKITTLFLTAILSITSISIMGQVSFGQSEKINSSWKFYLSDIPEAKAKAYDDSKWKSVEIPHDWSVKEQLSPTLASATGYLPGGIGWYRKTINIPKEKQDEKTYIYFEGVYNYSEVFINGHLLGKRPNGYISFMYDITPYIEYGKDNTIAVRVDHSQSADSRWYTGSGIYRDVWLIYANPIHIAQWGVYAYPEMDKSTGILNIELELENNTTDKSNLTIVNELVSSDNKVIAKNTQRLSVAGNQNEKITTNLKVKNPALWNLSNPNLYSLKTFVIKDGKEIDATITKTGFRSFTFDPNKGFALNGKW